MDISKEILLRNGFVENKTSFKHNLIFEYHLGARFYIELNYEEHTVETLRNWACRGWHLNIANFELKLQTVEQFNKLMEIMEIDFKLK